VDTSYHPVVPRRWLLGPVIGFLIVIAVLVLIAWVVPGSASIHGGWGGTMLLVFFVAFIIAGVVELFALAISITALIGAPELRTPANLTTVAVGAGPFVALASWLIYMSTA
jgi:hypothetical protein